MMSCGMDGGYSPAAKNELNRNQLGQRGDSLVSLAGPCQKGAGPVRGGAAALWQHAVVKYRAGGPTPVHGARPWAPPPKKGAGARAGTPAGAGAACLPPPPEGQQVSCPEWSGSTGVQAGRLGSDRCGWAELLIRVAVGRSRDRRRWPAAPAATGGSPSASNAPAATPSALPGGGCFVRCACGWGGWVDALKGRGGRGGGYMQPSSVSKACPACQAGVLQSANSMLPHIRAAKSCSCCQAMPACTPQRRRPPAGALAPAAALTISCLDCGWCWPQARVAGPRCS